MTERSEPGAAPAGRLAPRPRARVGRAGRGNGGPAPDSSWTLSASEIGAFAFCPQAWYLQRCGTRVTAEAGARRRAGSRRHRGIGRRTDLVRATGAGQAVLLLAVGALLILLATVALRGLAWAP